MEIEAHGPRFKLDRAAAIEAIATVWDLPPDPGAWRLDRFGEGLGPSIENLAGVVFAPGRRLLDGPSIEVRVFAVADRQESPLMVCLAGAAGPMVCTGIEDFATTLEDPWGCSPELVADALQRLLDVATETLAGHRLGSLLQPAPSPGSIAPAAPLASMAH